jgi:antitoxin MazE
MKQILPISSNLQIQSHLVPWGDDLCVRITQPLAKVAGFTVNSLVTMTAKQGKIIIETRLKTVTLDEMLAKFDPARHGGESMAYFPAGKEKL